MSSSRSTRHFGWALGALALFFAGSAAAGQVSQQLAAELKQNCDPDYLRLCSRFEQPSAEAGNCMRQHRSDLSPACNASFTAAEQAAAQ